MRQRWEDLQDAVASCTRCDADLPEAGVDCPPGVLYPADITPPNRVRVLFVGVAPPVNGCHFYTDPSDKLRRDLFKVLRALGRPCKDLGSFVAYGFFLVHTAKCAIRGTTVPDLRAAKLCSSIHLQNEIECLSPDSLCFLSKNVGFPVFQDLAERWGAKEQVKFGELTTVNVGGSPIDAIATAWPGRGHEVLTRVHLQALFCHLGLAI